MTVETRTEGRTLVVTIDRPKVRNAVDGPTAQLLYDTFVAFDADDELDVAVLTGTGDTFCAGADLKAIGAGRGNRVEVRDAGEIVGSAAPVGPTRLVLAKPVIAAIEGHAVAGGLELAIWCDLRVAATDAVLGVYCRRWGVPLVDGGTVRLPRLIGAGHAADLILTGRGVGGDEALMMGLVNRLCEPGRAEATAIGLARTLSGFPQVCLRSDLASAKAQAGHSFDRAMAYEVEVGMATIASGETRAGAQRFADGAGRGGTFTPAD